MRPMTARQALEILRSVRHTRDQYTQAHRIMDALVEFREATLATIAADAGTLPTQATFERMADALHRLLKLERGEEPKL